MLRGLTPVAEASLSPPPHVTFSCLALLADKEINHQAGRGGGVGVQRHNVIKGHNSCSGYYSGFTTASLLVAHLSEKALPRILVPILHHMRRYMCM